MTSSPPLVADNPAHHRFEVDLGDGEFAFAQYNLLPGAIRFFHTVVPAGHEGQGLGTELIRAGLAAARERGLKIIPICPFFAAYLRNHPEEQDLVAPEHRHLIE
jgi:predicted GNAT family acetyltransferase